jgi:hypothetical protein
MRVSAGGERGAECEVALGSEISHELAHSLRQQTLINNL